MAKRREPSVAEYALLCAGYVLIAWGITGGGMTTGKMVGLLLVGALFVLFVVSLPWIMRGPGQIDREVDE